MPDVESKIPPGASFVTDKTTTLASPGSETFSHAQLDGTKNSLTSTRANGASTSAELAPQLPVSAFELYCADVRPEMRSAHKDEGGDSMNLDEDLARGWRDLPSTEREESQARYERELEQYHTDQEQRNSTGRVAGSSSKRTDGDAPDDDVEMVNYDTEEQETQMEDKGD
jgi:non-histone protein 10